MSGHVIKLTGETPALPPESEADTYPPYDLEYMCDFQALNQPQGMMGPLHLQHYLMQYFYHHFSTKTKHVLATTETSQQHSIVSEKQLTYGTIVSININKTICRWIFVCKVWVLMRLRLWRERGGDVMASVRIDRRRCGGAPLCAPTAAPCNPLSMIRHHADSHDSRILLII